MLIENGETACTYHIRNRDTALKLATNLPPLPVGFRIYTTKHCGVVQSSAPLPRSSWWLMFDGKSRVMYHALTGGESSMNELLFVTAKAEAVLVRRVTTS